MQSTQSRQDTQTPPCTGGVRKSSTVSQGGICASLARPFWRPSGVLLVPFWNLRRHDHRKGIRIGRRRLASSLTWWPPGALPSLAQARAVGDRPLIDPAVLSRPADRSTSAPESTAPDWPSPLKGGLGITAVLFKLNRRVAITQPTGSRGDVRTYVHSFPCFPAVGHLDLPLPLSSLHSPPPVAGRPAFPSLAGILPLLLQMPRLGQANGRYCP
ncbi:hypothetical protein GQ53DRAFT_102933 [Thozetella sp. PMI_491]|nr:hypothetical protein GQ53DRAFT_102933 [Thozetella sp. PMI_491]